MFKPIGSQSTDNVTQPILLMSSGHSETYCDDLNCSCHTDVEYHSQVTGIPQHSSEDIRKAYSQFGIAQ